jgi:alpha-glucosidase
MLWLIRGGWTFLDCILHVASFPSDWTKIHTIVQKWQNYTTKKSHDSVLIGSSYPANLGLYGTKDLPELDIVVNFGLVPESPSGFYTAANFKTIITDYIKKLSKDNWPSWALTCWVNGRVGSNVDSKLARSLEALLLMLPGTPIVFYGDEIGMQNVNNAGNAAVDINKAPMQWENSTNGGWYIYRAELQTVPDFQCSTVKPYI